MRPIPLSPATFLLLAALAVLAAVAGSAWVATSVVVAHRPLSSLTVDFWAMLGTGAIGALTASWVLVLRGNAPGARCFALSGFGTLLSSAAVAIIQATPSLAPAHGRILMVCNLLGNYVLAASVAAMFLVFPARLLRPAWLWAFPAAIVLELAADVGGWWPDLNMGAVAFMLACASIGIGAIALQWRRSRGQALARASLRWLGLVLLLSTALYFVLEAVPAFSGSSRRVPEIVMFVGIYGLFYAGMMLGLLRYRLFDLDRWAFHLLLWVLGTAMFAAVDLALVFLLHLDRTMSLGLSLVACGALWLPLRGWLWQKVVRQRSLSPNELFQRVLQVALSPDDDTHRQRWRQLLRDMFAPLRMETVAGDLARPALEEHGQALRLPATARAPALLLRHAGDGRRLFSSRDADLAAEALDMLRHAVESHQAYDRGVREERQRISYDLHDDVGGKLLTLLHRVDPAQQAMVRDILHDIRTIQAQDQALQGTLLEVLALLRDETEQRLETARVALDWRQAADLPDPPLSPTRTMHLLRIGREAVTNALRHAQPRQLQVRIAAEGEDAVLEVLDDGEFEPGRIGGGRGTRSMRARATRLQGAIDWLRGPQGGTLVRLRFPLAPDDDSPASAGWPGERQTVTVAP